MAWYKVDDQLHSHPKARRAGLEAMGMWTLAGSHCMSYLTDGFVEEWFVQSWPHGPELAAQLVGVGLWLEAKGGWQFHDWDKYQPTRESVKAERDAATERKRRQRARGSDGRYESRVSHAVTSTVTDGVSHAERSSTPSPSPSPSPDPLLTESVSLAVTRESKTDRPPNNSSARPVDPRRIADLVETICDTAIDEPAALRLSNWIVEQAPEPVRHPHAYTERSIRNDPQKIQEWLDEEGK